MHDPDWLARHGDPFRMIYMEIDRAVARIIDHAPRDAVVIVFAGLGMGPNYTATNVMEEILARLDHRPLRRGTLGKRLTMAGWPQPVPRLGQKVDTAREILDLSRRRFYAMSHNENSGAIRINLKGREPMGQVLPDDFNAVCDDLTRAFFELRNPANGEPIVARVVRVADHMKGERLDSMPDLMVEWRRTAPFSALESPQIGRIERAASWGRTGDHTPHALIMAQGPGIVPGRLAEVPSIVDIAATIGVLQRVEMAGLDGKPILGLCGA
jgi:predicted AlkP superfamily phosphohydrolase/phosphomutase